MVCEEKSMTFQQHNYFEIISSNTVSIFEIPTWIDISDHGNKQAEAGKTEKV